MNYHKHLASFLTSSQIVVFSEGLNARDVIEFMPFERKLVISAELNKCAGLTAEERKELYNEQTTVWLSPPLVQSDILTRILSADQFSCVVCVNPDFEAVFEVNELETMYNVPFFVLYDSPLFLLKCTSVGDIRFCCSLRVRTASDRLILMPRLEKSVCTELRERKSEVLQFSDGDFAYMCEEVYRIIERYCALGRDEYCEQISRFSFAQFAASPYALGGPKMVNLLMRMLGKLEVADEADIVALVTLCEEQIDKEIFEFRNFDFSYARAQLEAVKRIAESSSSKTVMEQLDDFLEDFDSISVVFPCEFAMECFLKLRSATPDVAITQVIDVAGVPKYFSARKYLSFMPEYNELFNIKPNKTVVVYAPTLAVTRELEKIAASIDTLYVVQTPFLSSLTEAEAKFEYAAFSLLRTCTYKPQAQNNLTLRHRIYVDMRETRCPLPLQLKAREMDVLIAHLRTGDYIISPECAIERKAASDLVESVQDKRLFYELERLEMQFSMPFLLCEYGVQPSIFDQPQLLEYFCGALLKFSRVKAVWAREPAAQLVHLSETFGAADFDIDDVQSGGASALQLFVRALPDLRSREREEIMQKYKSVRELVLDEPSTLTARLGGNLADKLDVIFGSRIAENKV